MRTACLSAIAVFSLNAASASGPVITAHAASAHPSAPRAVTGGGSWTEYHHDDAHTGYDTSAPTVGSIGPTAGWVEHALDAEVYAEPLIFNGLVYAATLNDTVYALDQSTGTIVWSTHLGSPETNSSAWLCGNVSPQGILGTPVIDTGAGRIYAAAFFSDHLYRVFGLDLATGAIVLTTPIPAGIGTGFDWTIQQQRGALGLSNGYVYVPFGGRAGDCGPYHGWVVGVPTSGSTSLTVFENTSTGAGMWSAGGVVIDDATHDVFVASGNAIPCAGAQMSDSIIRLSPTLGSPTFFQPNDWQSNWCGPDSDLGSASLVLISSNLAFTAGKHGGGFLLDPANLGGTDGQLFPTPKPAPYGQADVCFGNHSDATFGSFAYAAPFVYIECEGHGIVALNVNTGTPSFSVCSSTCGAPDWHAGGTTTYGPPIVAGGAVWAASNGGGLSAFDAATGTQLFQSAGFGVNRFVTPAEAGGQVFVPARTVIKSFSFAAPPSPAAYAGVTPTRLMDTRNSGGPLGVNGTRNLTVAGVSGVPANASSVVLNVTATNTTAPSYLTVFAAGSSPPLSSNLNWVAGDTVPNLVTVPVGAGGAVTFMNRFGSVDVVADLEGYFAPPSGTAGGEVALTPARLADHHQVTTNSSFNVQVSGFGGVPGTGVSAVVLNVTASEPTTYSYLTAWPQGAAQPATSNLNFAPGQTVANRVIVPVGGTGGVSILNRFGNVNVTVDVDGYFTDATATGKFFVPTYPIRIKDTRSTGQRLGQSSTLTLPVSGRFFVPSTATSIIANVTVTNTSTPSYLTVFPCGAQPATSDVNWSTGQTVPNLALATLSGAGSTCIFNRFGTVDVVVDLVGYFN